MDKNEAKVVMKEAEAAMVAVFAAHSMKVSGLRATYDEGLIKLSITGTSTDPALDPKVTDWKRYAAGYGFPEDALGTIITVNRKPFRIDGLVPSRSKYPVAVTDITANKPMLLTVPGVKRALGLPVESWER